MRNTILEKIRIFTNKLSLINVDKIEKEADFPKLFLKPDDQLDLGNIALAYLRYIVQEPAHHSFLNTLDDWHRFYFEKRSASIQPILSSHTSNIILSLAFIWDAQLLSDASTHARNILSDLLWEMSNDDPTGLFRLGRHYTCFPDQANPHSKKQMEIKQDKFEPFDSVRTRLVYSSLFELAFFVSFRILGKDATTFILEYLRPNDSLSSKPPISVFAYKAANYLWDIKAYAPAAILYKQAIQSNTKDSPVKLSQTELLDAYVSWGVCQVELDKPSEAYSIYNEWIALDTQSVETDKAENKAKGILYSNMAYVCGKLADCAEDGSKKQREFREIARINIDKALSIDPNDSASLQTSGTLYYDEGNLERALEEYDKCSGYNMNQLSALRAGIEIRLEQLCNVSASGQAASLDVEGTKKKLVEKLKEYSELYNKLKDKSKPADYDELEIAETILANYDPNIDTKNAPYSEEIGICLLEIYMCANDMKSTLRYTVPEANSNKDATGKGNAYPVIAYYTKMKDLNYLLEKRIPKLERDVPKRTVHGHEQEQSEWPDYSDASSNEKNLLTMMHISYMNDPNEGQTLLQILSHAVKGGILFDNSTPAKFRNKLLDEKFVFMKSFTSLIDQLNMWVMYASDRSEGSDSNGCCVCIAPETFRMMVSAPETNEKSKQIVRNHDDLHLYRVAYISPEGLTVPGEKDRSETMKLHFDKLVELFTQLNNKLDASDDLSAVWRALSRSLSFIAFLFKDASYRLENELRLIITRDKSNRAEIDITSEDPKKLYYNPPYQVYVERIILGPKLSSPDRRIPYLQFKLAEMWDSWPASQRVPRIPKVRKSSINYRD